MANPFEDESSIYHVLINDEGQHSLWPTQVEVPTGWAIAHGPVAKAECLAYIESNWVDMRPRSLLNAISS
jgi:MbtH protein